MNQKQREKFLEVLAGVHDFYGKELSNFAAQVWLQACESMDVAEVTRALSSHLMDPDRGQFMPKPADIVRKLQGTTSDRAALAWGKVLDAGARVGAYRSVCFDDPVIHAAIEDMGGWPHVCRLEGDQLSYAQHRFSQTYKAYSERPSVNYPAMLPGEHAIANAVKGYQTEPPALIGDARKAQQVLANGSHQPKTQITNVGAALLALGRSEAA